MTSAKQIYLICGSGGVGKTTISAALGLMFAINGKKSIVLTIDPARRLASSLGISKLNNLPKKIKLPSNKKGGEMWAMMLDTKKTFDLIVEKYAPSHEAMQTILNNRIYQHMSRMLAGTQEYMAMEKLYEIHQQHDFEVIILDTPPMQNAMEFLSAPQKMINMINNSMLKLLLKPTFFFGKSSLKILEKGAKQIFKVLDRIAGLTFLQELSEMFILLKDLLGGFQERAAKVNKLLADPNCNFFSICTTNDNSIAEIHEFKRQLNNYKYHLEKVIVNRVYANDHFSMDLVEGNRAALEKHFKKADAQYLIDNIKKYEPLVNFDNRQLDELTGLVGIENVATVPLFLSDVHDLEGLSKVADALKDKI